MTTLFYDGSFEGLLTAVFDIYTHKLGLVKLKLNGAYDTALFGSEMTVVTDEAKAKRVLKGLSDKLTSGGLQRLYAAYLSEIKEEDNPVVGYIRYVFDSDRSIEENYGNKYVRRVSEIVRMVRREKHRMEAFIRFQKLNDGTFYATVEPDFNVLPLILRHFKNRYADQKWIIYDTLRAYGLYYDQHRVEYVTFDFNTQNNNGLVSQYDSDEGIYQLLWKDYFKSVNIAARKNTKLHLRHVPKRYWKNLTEKL
ncbi:TIGR03915 family putative DNA repair protein [Mucilaginibacter sp. HMF5004]|uniref:TIGR03915 family putative DNA repair protein n=1 Tax=Mucilaginibacter rivuli TaxID=2857527 RepID=UPI001C5CF88F|nr:TIGR03915 family putative DNA repair protein [Mucilaginibacter rivuli]MBW4891638.1 TIGR03915 family putative DNA repair protein [Mucilaginibacter rivuli]